MKISGIIMVAVGAVMMVASFFYSPIVHYSVKDRWDIIFNDMAANPGATPDPRVPEDLPAQVHSSDRAQRRELGFMGGGAMLIAGVILFVGGSFRRSESKAE